MSSSGRTRRAARRTERIGERVGSRRRSLARLPFLRGGEVDARLRELCAARGAALPVVGPLAEAFVGRKLHEELGYRSIGDWSREKLGLGARTVRDWGRVWSRLQRLPLLREAVCSGEVSFAVARRVVGVVTPETEAACLAEVRGRTVRAVDAMVRAVREAEQRQPCDPQVESSEDEPRILVRIPCAPESHGMWNVAVELARRVAGEALPVWTCAEWIVAEAASAVGSAGAREDAGASDDVARAIAAVADPERVERPVGSASEERGLREQVWPGLCWRPVRPALPEELAGLAQGLDTCAASEVARRFRAAIAFLQARDLEIGRFLRQVVARRLHRELGFASFDHYVQERLDLAPRTGRRLAALALAEDQAPAVARAFEEGRLTSLQAAAVLRASRRTEPGPASRHVPEDLPEDQPEDLPEDLPSDGPEAVGAWVARAERVSLRRLEDEVEAQPSHAIVFLAPPEVAAAFLAMVRRVGLVRMLAHAIRTWVAWGDQFHDYADFERDGYRCTVPGCTARRGLESHHIWFRSARGPDVAWNRTTLCQFHHRHAMHGLRAGRLRIRGRAPNDLTYQLGGPSGERWRSGDVRMT